MIGRRGRRVADPGKNGHRGDRDERTAPHESVTRPTRGGCGARGRTGASRARRRGVGHVARPTERRVEADEGEATSARTAAAADVRGSGRADRRRRAIRTAYPASSTSSPPPSAPKRLPPTATSARCGNEHARRAEQCRRRAAPGRERSSPTGSRSRRSGRPATGRAATARPTPGRVRGRGGRRRRGRRRQRRAAGGAQPPASSPTSHQPASQRLPASASRKTRGAKRGRTKPTTAAAATSSTVSGKRSRSLRSIRASSSVSAPTGSSLGSHRSRPLAMSAIETRPSMRVESDVSSPLAPPPTSAIG